MRADYVKKATYTRPVTLPRTMPRRPARVVTVLELAYGVSG